MYNQQVSKFEQAVKQQEKAAKAALDKNESKGGHPRDQTFKLKEAKDLILGKYHTDDDDQNNNMQFKVDQMGQDGF